MTKLLAIALFTASLAACTSMSGNGNRSTMGNTADLQHSSDSAATRNGNPAAVSPGGGGK